MGDAKTGRRRHVDGRERERERERDRETETERQRERERQRDRERETERERTTEPTQKDTTLASTYRNLALGRFGVHISLALGIA